MQAYFLSLNCETACAQCIWLQAFRRATGLDAKDKQGVAEMYLVDETQVQVSVSVRVSARVFSYPAGFQMIVHFISSPLQCARQMLHALLVGCSRRCSLNHTDYAVCECQWTLQARLRTLVFLIPVDKSSGLFQPATTAPMYTTTWEPPLGNHHLGTFSRWCE